MPVYLLDERIIFPPVEDAENGVVAVGGDLSTERLLAAYRYGIFPWYSDDEPIIWWSPDPRFVLMLDELHISKSMHRVLNSGKFTVTFDHDFPFIIQQCANVRRPGEYGTWITPDMIAAFCKLHEEGYAHSIEVWHKNKIVGGLYGVSMGKCFFAESMFHTEANASKFAFIMLAAFLKEKEFLFLDAQIRTEHVETLGAKNISRESFLNLLDKGLQYDTAVGKWNNT